MSYAQEMVYAGPERDYKNWCKSKGYKTEENIFDALFALLFWPICFFTGDPELPWRREYNSDLRTGRWKPYGQH